MRSRLDGRRRSATIFGETFRRIPLSEEGKTIKVVDRRMFTADGELRPEFQESEAAAPEAKAGSESPVPPVPEAPPPEGTEEDPVFVQMLQSLATTAYGALGLLPDPAGRTRMEPHAARQMIDWLGALERKTRGRLSFSESDLLAQILYELRMAYVKATEHSPKAR
jgi:Domain of unknown function (DUF1844)